MLAELIVMVGISGNAEACPGEEDDYLCGVLFKGMCVLMTPLLRNLFIIEVLSFCVCSGYMGEWVSEN